MKFSNNEGVVAFPAGNFGLSVIDLGKPVNLAACLNANFSSPCDALFDNLQSKGLCLDSF